AGTRHTRPAAGCPPGGRSRAGPAGPPRNVYRKSPSVSRGVLMPEAVIVSIARSPIGRAMKGSLKDVRPDDLAAQMVRAALDQVPELDVAEVEDLILGCGQPAGQSGFNIARTVAVQLGYDAMPGVTVNRYCSSSLQTTRMAMNAIRAGE